MILLPVGGVGPCGGESLIPVSHPVCWQHPTDVDYRVMATFTEFYTTLLGFVNFRLYHSLNLLYPPKVRPAPWGHCVPPTWGGGNPGWWEGGWKWEICGIFLFGSCLLTPFPAQIDSQAEDELKPAEGKEYAMDSESYMEVRDTAGTVTHGDAVGFVSCPQPSWCGNEDRARSLQGGRG